MNKLLFPISIVLLFAFVEIAAQTSEGKGLGTEQVNVVKDYEPTIINANRFWSEPTIFDSIPPTPKLKYETITKQYPTYFKVEPIPHATMKGEPLIKLQNHYSKAGFGNYNTTLVEYAFSSGRAKKYNYAINARHFSSSGNIKNKLYPGVSENFINANGKVLFKKNILSGDLGYNRDAVHYYGIYDTLKADNIKLNQANYYQWFGNIFANASLKGLTTDSLQLNYLVKANYYTYFDNYNSLETNVKLVADLGKNHDKEWFGANAGIDYFYNTTALVNDANAFIINVSPRAEFNAKKLKGRVGARAFVQSDTLKSVFNFLPDIDFKLAIVERFIHFNIGVNGNVYRNSYKRITTENPFVIPTTQIANTTEKLNIYTNLYGALGDRLNYFTSLEYKRTNNILLFKNFYANTLGNRFITIYDTGAVLKATGELAYQTTEKFRLLGRAEYFNYWLKNEIRPWQLPTLNLTLAGKYNLYEKIIIGLDIFYIGNRFGNIFVSDETVSPIKIKEKSINLKPVTDINLMAEYRYTKTLSGFLRLNNIAAMRYYRWNNYPTYRFNFLLGFTYSF